MGICDEESKPQTPEDYDKIVCAEIPNAQQFPIQHRIVTTLMMHGPCGTYNQNSPCMVDSVCSKNFPKDFAEQTLADSNGYPCNRRRNDGQCIEKNGILLDNRHVVPYNPCLSTKYNAHINVEICSSIKSCKYLYKYVYKGPDMTSLSTEIQKKKSDGCDEEYSEKKVDEINKFVNSRFMTF